MPEYTVRLTYIQENIEANSPEEATEIAAKNCLNIEEREEPYVDYFNEKEAIQTESEEEDEEE